MQDDETLLDYFYFLRVADLNAALDDGLTVVKTTKVPRAVKAVEAVQGGQASPVVERRRDADVVVACIEKSMS